MTNDVPAVEIEKVAKSIESVEATPNSKRKLDAAARDLRTMAKSLRESPPGPAAASSLKE